MTAQTAEAPGQTGVRDLPRLLLITVVSVALGTGAGVATVFLAWVASVALL